MKKVFILYNNFLTPDGKNFTIGGVQTYIKALVDIIKDNGMIPIIMQHGKHDFRKDFQDIKIIGIETKENWSTSKKNKLLFNECMKICDPKKDIIIVGSHSMGVRNNLNNVVGIQHGIAFDRRCYENTNTFTKLIDSIKRVLSGYNAIIKARKFNYLVAVDYNFLNWFRTMPGFKKDHVKVIPNFVRCKNFTKNDNINGKIKIIFARRFEKHRGTRLFATVVLGLLDKFSNIHITFAGNGPDEEYLKKLFEDTEQVRFFEYDSKDSLDIHKAYDIAVIPTIGSEGTSLSLLESMAAKCAVVATNVGGMTNIVLDNFNGLLVDPNENELSQAIEKLIKDEELRRRLAENAYVSVSEAFNFDIWESKWIEVLNNINNDIQL